MNITKKLQCQSHIETPVPALTGAPHPEARLEPLTFEDITGDIEGIISKTIAPYIDPTSFALNAEDLRGECRAKLARIISEGHLAKCPTRAKAFAFVKVAFRNHVRSLVEKNAFSMKRTGQKAPLAGNLETMRKPTLIRIDDPEIDFQLGVEDISVRQHEFLEELFCCLSPSETDLLNDLMNNEAEIPNGAATFGLTERQIRRQLPKNVRTARANLLRKCHAILADCD